MKHSICITNYNSIGTLRKSMDSIINQLNDDSEIVVCDNCSSDGSKEILQEYERIGQIKLFVEQSSRGKGRQIAFEKSSGQYIISGIDTDDVLKPAFKKFVQIYHKCYEGYMLSLGTIHILPRALVKEIGGWRDLNYFEDVDFRVRSEALRKWRELQSPIILVERGKSKDGFIQKMKEQYTAVECAYKIRQSIFIQAKTSKWRFKPILFVIALVAGLNCRLNNVQRFQ